MRRPSYSTLFPRAPFREGGPSVYQKPSQVSRAMQNTPPTLGNRQGGASLQCCWLSSPLSCCRSPGVYDPSSLLTYFFSQATPILHPCHPYLSPSLSAEGVRTFREDFAKVAFKPSASVPCLRDAGPSTPNIHFEATCGKDPLHPVFQTAQHPLFTKGHPLASTSPLLMKLP